MDLSTRQGRSRSGSRALAVRRLAGPADFFGVQKPFLAFGASFLGPSLCSGCTLAVKGQKLSLCDDQIGQRKEDVQLRRVLLQPLVADLAMAEEILHDVRGVLDLRAAARLDRFQATQQRAKFALRRWISAAARTGARPQQAPAAQPIPRAGAGSDAARCAATTDSGAAEQLLDP